MARQYFKPKQSSIPETYKGYEINFGYLLNGQPAWEGFDKNKNIGIFRSTRDELINAIDGYSPIVKSKVDIVVSNSDSINLN